MHALWTWCVAHPVAAIAALVVASKLVGAVVSSFWYAIRRSVFGPVETAKLPGWARVVQGLVEGICNLPGTLRAWFPPGADPAAPPPAPLAPATPTPATPAAPVTTGGNP